MEYIIFGAQAIAYGTYMAIKVVYPEWKIKCFMVTSIENNPNMLLDIPVKELKDICIETGDKSKETKILIATPENVMPEIETSLLANGFNNFEKITSVRWAELQKRSYEITKSIKTFSDIKDGVKETSLEVYMAKFWKDQLLLSEYQVPNYLIPIQVGAANSKVTVANIFDNEGENISDKNSNYSELTALYWMWKNKIVMEKDKNKYYGLAHYRRFIELSNDEIKKLDKVDVVLPFPMMYIPNINTHHNRYLTDNEWNAVCKAVEEKAPDYIVAMQEIFNQEYMYNYNILIAKKDIIDEYCNWLFPILFRIEDIIDNDGDHKPNRYIGYIAESLETLYFMHNKDNLNIVHAGCKFLT